MALKNKYIKDDGASITGYYRITQVHTQYEKVRDLEAHKLITFELQAFDYNTSGQLTSADYNVRRSYELKEHYLNAQDQTVSGLIVSAYEHLKTLDHFGDAIDC